MAKKSPAAAEATGTPIEFEHNGNTYSVLPSNLWPIEALEAFEDGKAVAFLRAILAPGSWDAYKATGATVADLAAFVEAVQTACGLPGN